ncbi:MAG: alpha/beta hydrolase [Albidovulum sp.]|nr:alpha/beta hydrolase [Albidovulum sp.]
MTYRNFPIKELIRQYSPREAVPEHPVWKAHWSLFSELARKTRAGKLRVPYGPTPGQTLDIFPANEPDSPINIFVHGGFWRFLDSFDHTLVAPAVLDAGGASILLNYDLCPTVPLTEVIRQVRSALKWVWDNAEQANGDRDKIFLSGHSAGGHLALMMSTGDFNSEIGLPDNVVKGATIVSAMLDLEPILLVPGCEDLLITEDTFRDVSPKYRPPDPAIPLVVAVGGRETSEWIRQTEDMLAVLKDQGSSVKYLKPDYDQHYSILFSLGNPMTELCSSMLTQMGLNRINQ